MTEMFGEAWSPMSVPDLAPDDDDDTEIIELPLILSNNIHIKAFNCFTFFHVIYKKHSKLKGYSNGI